jgi:hypothetical protein
VAKKDKAGLDSTHNLVEIPFQLADQPEDTKAQGAQHALALSEIGKVHPKINICILTKAHITNVKARILVDTTAAPASGDDDDDHKAKLSADLPRCSLTLLGSPVDVKTCNPSSASVALTPGGKDNDDDDEAELSAYLLRSSLSLVGFPALQQLCTGVALQTPTLTRLSTVDRTQRKKAKTIRRRFEQCVKRATEICTLPTDRNDPNKTASDWNGAIQQLATSPEMWKKVLKFMQSSRPALLQRARLDDVSKVRCASLSVDTPSFMLGAVRNGMDVTTLPNFVQEALASAEAANRVQNKLARQFSDQVKTRIPRSRRGTHKIRRFLKAQLNQSRAQADAKIRRVKASFRIKVYTIQAPTLSPTSKSHIALETGHSTFPESMPTNEKIPLPRDGSPEVVPIAKPQRKPAWPRGSHQPQFAHRKDQYRHEGFTEAEMWEAHNPAEATRLLGAMRHSSTTRFARSDLQSKYEAVWKSNCIPQPFSLFRHLVRKLWAEQEDDNVARWSLWTEFAAKAHVVTAPADVTSLRAFLHEHRDMTRGEILGVLAVMKTRHDNLKEDFPYTTDLFRSWMTTDRAAQTGCDVKWEGQIFVQQGMPVIGDETSVRTTTVTYDAASSDSVASVLACFPGAQRLFGATNYPGGETRREHDSVLSLEAAGIRAGMTLHLLLRLHGGVINPPTAAEASLQPSLHAENGEASAASQKDKGPAEENGEPRTTATFGGEAASEGEDTSIVTWKRGDFGVNVDNVLYWTGIAPADSYEIALAAHLEAAWTSFANGLDMNSLKAACKVRQLVVQTSEGHVTKRKADFLNALLTWVRTNGAVIAAFEVAHGPGQPPEASQAWWCQYDAPQDPQGLKFCLGVNTSWDEVLTQWKVLRETASRPNGQQGPLLQHQPAGMPPPAGPPPYQPLPHGAPPQFQTHPGALDRYGTRLLPLPVGAPSSATQSPFGGFHPPSGWHPSLGQSPLAGGGAWTSTASNSVFHGPTKAIPPAPSWPPSDNTQPPAWQPAGHSNIPGQWPHIGWDVTAGGYRESEAGRQHSHSAFGGSMAPFLAEQSNQAPYISPHAHVGQGPPGPIAQDPQQAPYHALQGKAVMALVLDVHGVGRWMACRFYFPAASPNLQGHFEDTVMFANNIAVPVDRSKVAPGQTHRIGTEWHSLDWGSPYPAPVLNPATSLHANSESFGIFSFRAVNHLRGFAETQPMAPAHVILQEVIQARCEALRHLVESRFRIHINTQNPSVTILPHPSNPHSGGTVALTCASLLDMLEAEMPRGSFQWTPKRAKTTQDHQQPQSRGDTPHATPPKFDLGDFGNTLAKGLLQEMAKLQAASTQSLLQHVHTGKASDINDSDTDEKILQKRIALVRKQPFHLLELDNMEDQQGSITVYMNILKKVCNDRLDPKVVLGMPGYKNMQIKADLEARAKILKGDSFQRFHVNLFEQYVMDKLDQHYITAEMCHPYSTPETCPVLKGLNAMKLAFRPGWIAVERLLQSPAYSGHMFDSEAGTAAVLRSQFVIIKNALDCTLAPSEARANAAYGLIMHPGMTMQGAVSSSQPASSSPMTSAAVLRDGGNSWPNSSDLIGKHFGKVKQTNCRQCFKVGHDAFECPVRFYSRTNQCMPGFDQAGNRLMNYWYDTAEMLGPSREIAAEWLAHAWQTAELLNEDKHNGLFGTPPCGGKTLWESWARGVYPTR